MRTFVHKDKRQRLEKAIRMHTRYASRRFFLASIGAACYAASNKALGQTLIPLTIGMPPFDACTPMLAGVRSGIYQRYGFDVELQRMSGSAAAAAIVGGSLQFGASNVISLITAHAKGIPFQIVAPGSLYRSEKPAAVLVVRKDAPIHRAADLDGKIIATPSLADLYSNATLAWIDQNGGDSKTVHQVEVSSAAGPAALASGRIDAAVIGEPFLNEILRSGNVRVLGHVYDAIGKRYLAGALFAMADFINADRSMIQRFARAQHEANAFANAHPDKTAPWLAEFTHVDVDTILHGTREIFDESIVIVNVQRVIDAAARFKLIERTFDARDLISPLVR